MELGAGSVSSGWRGKDTTVNADVYIPSEPVSQQARLYAHETLLSTTEPVCSALRTKG